MAEVTLRQYARERKQGLGWSAHDLHATERRARAGRPDWYEAWAELSREPKLMQVFSMRRMTSGAAFHRATQQAFLEACGHVFQYFQDVFRCICAMAI